MANPHVDLQALTVRREAINGPLLRPPARWFSRVILPGLILAGFAGLALWVSWDLLAPAAPVKVTPVIYRSEIREAGGAELFKTNGWIEPRPFPTEVPALAEGFVKELLVVPSQRVRAGDEVARLIADDAELAVQAAQAELTQRQLEVGTATAELEEARAQARIAQVTVDIETRRITERLTENRAQLDQALAQKQSADAKVQQAESRLRLADAKVWKALTVDLPTAELRMKRMTVRAPVGGVVMRLNAAPGVMVGKPALSTAQPVQPGSSILGMPDSLLTLYDPYSLQVRVEVPYNRFQYVTPGQPAWIEIDEIYPGRRLLGTVSHDTQMFNVTRTSVPVKVVIVQCPEGVGLIPGCFPNQGMAAGAARLLCDGLMTLAPSGRLRPEGIATVHFLAPPSEKQEPGGAVQRIMVPRRLLASQGDQPAVWIVDQAAGRAVLRPVTLAPGEKDRKTELVEVTQGLLPTDKLITAGRESLQPGDRVRIVGEEQ